MTRLPIFLYLMGTPERTPEAREKRPADLTATPIPSRTASVSSREWRRTRGRRSIAVG